MTDIGELIKDKANQTVVAEYVYERLYNRFLKIFDFPSDIKAEYEKKDKQVSRNVFTEEYKNGFLMMASCSLLIETFAAFLTGQNETSRGKSPDMFNKIFEFAESKNNELKVFKNGQFYKNIRCGLLHQGEVYGKFTITRAGNNLIENEKVNATLFCKALKELLLAYKSHLADGAWDSKEWDACRLKIRHIITNAQ